MVGTYFALISCVNGKKAMRRYVAVEYILPYTGELSDPENATLFARSVPVYPAGTVVRLNTEKPAWLLMPEQAILAGLPSGWCPTTWVTSRNGHAVLT